MTVRILKYLIAAAVVFPSVRCFADIVTYAVDPARSSLTINGTWGSAAIAPDLAGEDLIVSYSGTLLADRNYTENTLTISGGTIAAQNTTGLFAPYSTPANYGFNQQDPNVLAAIRNFSFSLTSQLITSPSSFDASSITADIDSGQVDFAVFTETGDHPVTFSETDGSTVLVGGFALGSGLASVTDAQGVETLAIPIQANYATQLNGEPLQVSFSGTIVATSPIPEPTTSLIFTISALLLYRRRREKQS